MKNFFKKLSFVLAIAMVLTSIAPATASAAEVVPAKKVNVKNLDGEKITSVELDVEETKTVKIGLPVKKAYEGQKSSFKTWAVAEDDTVVEIARPGNRKYDLTGLKAGETTITITAAKTKKAAVAGKDHGCKPITITVVVSEKAAELTATQAGKNSITVTGTDLTAEKADYVVKRGVNTVAIATATANEDGSVTLVASSKNLIAGDYTLAFKDSEAVEFAVEASKVDEIIFLNDTAILQTASTAAIKYVVENQFDEVITGEVSADMSVVTSCDTDDNTDATITNNVGIITFGKSTGFIQTVDVVTAVVAHKTTAVSATGTFTVSAMSRLDSVEVVGLYEKQTDGSFKAVEALKEGTLTDNKYYLAVNVKDQYGDTAVADDFNAQNIKLNVMGGLTLAGADETTPINLTDANGQFIAVGYEIVSLATGDNAGKLSSGTVSVLAVILTSAKQASATFEVTPAVKVDTFSIAAVNGMYAGKKNYVDFTAIDTEGNEVTAFGKLYGVVTLSGSGFDWDFEKQLDGSAKLWIKPAAAGAFVVTSQTPLLKYATYSLTAQAKCVPTAIAGFNSAAITGAIVGDTAGIQIPLYYVNVEDQYGNAMTSDEVVAAVSDGAVTFDVTFDANNTLITEGTCEAQPTSKYDNIVDANVTATKSAVTVTVALKYGAAPAVLGATTGNEIPNSSATVVLRSVYLEECTSFEHKAIGLQQAYAGAATPAAVTMYGYAGATKVVLPATTYKVVLGGEDQIVSIPAINTADDNTVGKDYTKDVVVVIANKAGTEVTFTVDYSERPRTVTTVALNNQVFLDDQNVNTVADVLDCLTIKDQYGNVYTSAELAATTRVKVSGYSPVAQVQYNGTTAMQFVDPYVSTVHVVVTFNNGCVFESDVIVY